MNKYLLIIIGVFAVGIIFAVVRKTPDNNSKKELELTYEINAGIPFKWVYEIEDPTIVQFVKSYVIQDDNTDGKVGASVYTNYVFKGLKEGETTITFKMVSITGEYEDTSVELHKVKVDAENNIFLVKEKENYEK